jgi:MFS superfamily sulfate permease-like transporter
MNFIVLGVIFFVFLPFFGYLPTCVLKSLNLVSAYIMINFTRIFSFWKLNKFYQIMVFYIGFGMMMFGVGQVLLSGLVISWVYYLIASIFKG